MTMSLMFERRGLLKCMSTVPLLLASRSALAAEPSSFAELDMIANDLRRFIALGSKASGGNGDNAAGEWFAQELATAGFTVERTPFQVPFFAPLRVELEAEGLVAPLIPQAVVTTAPRDGVEGPLFRLDPQAPAAIPKGAIVIVDLPRQGWSSATAPLIARSIALCEQAEAKGIVLLTNGPTGEGIALNAHEDRPISTLPTACLAPRDAQAFLDIAARKGGGRLFLVGETGHREAFNVAGRRYPANARKTVVISTPRSGWFACAAERGPGIAIWLNLLRWLANANLPVNLIFSTHSGHEYENLGLRHQLPRLPKPTDIDLWLMFGAGAVTRATKFIDGKISTLTSPAERLLTVTDNTEALAHRVFTGWPGWSDPTFARGGGASEAGTAIAHGYGNVVGFNGGNPYHHVHKDLGSNVDPMLIRRLSIGCRELISNIASAHRR